MGLLPGYWGNLFWGVMPGGRSTRFISLGDYQTFPSAVAAAIRSTLRSASPITQIDLFVDPGYFGDQSGNFRVGIQRDDGGNPNGAWLGDVTVPLGQNSPYMDALRTSERWSRIPLSTPVNVTVGEIIHIVIEAISVTGPIGITGMYPNNKLQPYDLYEDPVLAGLAFDGSSWRETPPTATVSAPFRNDILSRLSPSYVITHQDGFREGQPYHTAWDGMHVFSGSCHGQIVRNFFGDMLVDRIGFLIKRRGIPTSPLNLAVYDIDVDPPNKLVDIEFATEAEVPATGMALWIERTVSLSLLANRRYQFQFTAEGPDFNNAWIIMTEGAFGPLGEADLGSYRTGLNFGGFQSYKTEGCNVPANLFYPDDLPFYLHYVTGPQHELTIESSVAPIVLDGMILGLSPQTRTVADGPHTPEVPYEA